MSVKVSRYFLAALFVIVCASFIGCRVPPPPPPGPETDVRKNFQAPPSAVWGGVPSSGENWIRARVTPGPPRWCYVLESRTTDTGGTNVLVPLDGFSGLGFTNVQVVTSGCTVTNVSPGWEVATGSRFTFVNTNGSSRLEFCLDCPESTNRAISLTVIIKNGTNVTVGPMAGPRP